ncbi:hypothetical protein HY008_01845 [Candidatus Woesebacteria bacterium]|nr:hypothetical protein [Candidatus Woesebacteria bacterium]
MSQELDRLPSSDRQDRHISDFSRLISPVEVDTFFREYWEKKPLIISRNQSDYYAELLTLNDVDNIITSRQVRFPAIGLVKDGVRLPPSQFTSDIPWGNNAFTGVINVDKVLSEFQQGTTIILEALHQRWEPLKMFCHGLEKYLNHPVQTNIYLTPRGSQGFAPHYDTHDVLALQTAGTKHWRIYSSPIELPGSGQTYEKSRFELGEPLHELDFNSGDFMYIPRGYIHEALTSESVSLHITVGVTSYTWADVFSEVLTLCREDPRFRRSLPVGFIEQNARNSSLMREQFAELLEVFSKSGSLDYVIDRIADRFVFTRPQIFDNQLTELTNIDNVGLLTSVRKREEVISRIKLEDDTVSLIYSGKKIKFPQYVEPALYYIANNNLFNAESIPCDIDDEGKLTLVRRLIREGFLTTKL